MAMSVEDARELLRAEVAASSLNAVADRVQIDRSTLRTFLVPGGVKKPIARVLEPILAYAESRLSSASPAAGRRAPPPAGVITVAPEVAAYYRGVLDTTVRTLAGAIQSLDGLRALLSGTHDGMAGMAASGVLPFPADLPPVTREQVDAIHAKVAAQQRADRDAATPPARKAKEA